MRYLEYSFAKICIDSSAYRAFKNIDLETFLDANGLFLVVWSIFSFFMLLGNVTSWLLYFSVGVSGVLLISTFI